MNINRFVGAIVGVWIVRAALNSVFYGKIAAARYEQIRSAHPDIFRTVIPAYIVTDLIFAAVFLFLFTKVGAAMGSGVKAGIALGVFVAVLSPVIGDLYYFYTVTYLPASLVATDSIFQVIAHAVEGAVAGLIYKHGPSASTTF